MAGKPVTAAFNRQVREWGGWTAVLERIADGETTTKVAADLGVSRSFFQHQVKRAGLLDALREARKMSAESMIDQAIDVTDNVAPDRDEIAKARERANVRLRIAAMLDRAAFGAQSAPPAVVNINVGQLHLDALRQQRVELEAVEAKLLPPAPTEPDKTP